MMRAVLALLLVLNGFSGAAASARMALHHGGAEMAAASDEVRVDAQSTCHEGMSTPHATSGSSSPSDAHASDAECCADGSCLCACVLHCSAVPVTATIAMSQALGDLAVSRGDDGAPDPVRTHLIRPPIR